MNVKLFLQLSLGVVLLATPALATSNYQYKPAEYVVIVNGKSPNGKYAIATHGEGELGDENFHVYLMGTDPAKPVAPLEEITDFLDTNANAFYARWSKNSRQVSISYRTDRRVVVKISYYTAHGRPDLLQKQTRIRRLPR